MLEVNKRLIRYFIPVTLPVFFPILEDSAYKESLKCHTGLCFYLPRKGANICKKQDDEQLSVLNCSSNIWVFSPVISTP